MEVWTSSSPWPHSDSNLTSSNPWTYLPGSNDSWPPNNQTTSMTNFSPFPAGGGSGPHPVPGDIQTLQLLNKHLDQVMPVTLCLGILGNVLAVLVFMTSALKFVSLSHYLSALAVADMMNLLAGLVLWVSQHWWNLYTKVGVCQLTSFILLMSRG